METAERWLLSCPDWAVEHQQYFGDSIDITDVFQDSDNLVEFLISLGHLSSPCKHRPDELVISFIHFFIANKCHNAFAVTYDYNILRLCY